MAGCACKVKYNPTADWPVVLARKNVIKELDLRYNRLIRCGYIYTKYNYPVTHKKVSLSSTYLQLYACPTSKTFT